MGFIAQGQYLIPHDTAVKRLVRPFFEPPDALRESLFGFSPANIPDFIADLINWTLDKPPPSSILQEA
jgi:hypothetical protein